MARRNPTGPAVTIVAVAFRKHPGFLRELRASDIEPTFDQAALLLSQWSGQSYSLVRSQALATLTAAVRRVFTDPEEAMQAIVNLDPRMGVWCACACARRAVGYVPDYEERPEEIIAKVEAWVRGKGKPTGLTVLAKGAGQWIDENDVYQNTTSAVEACIALADGYKDPNLLWTVVSHMKAADYANGDYVSDEDYVEFLTKPLQKLPSTL